MNQLFFTTGFAISTVIFVIFILASIIINCKQHTAEEKRRWFRRQAIIVGILFAITTTFMAGTWNKPFAMLVTCAIIYPATVLSTWLNIRRTFFCDACGKRFISQNPFSTVKFCPKCGAAVQTKL